MLRQLPARTDQNLLVPMTEMQMVHHQENADVVSALVSLGYSVQETSRAVNALPAGKKLTLEEKIKLTLQYLGK